MTETTQVKFLAVAWTLFCALALVYVLHKP
jgi:hypothetical protein